MEEGAFDPRRRLVGAVVLVVLAVLVLPALLRRPASQAAGQEVLVVRRSGHSVTSVLAVAPPHSSATRGRGQGFRGEDAPGNGSGRAPGAPALYADGAVPVGHRPAPIGPAASKALAQRTPAPILPWYVQVGAYINAGDAVAFVHELKGQGFPAHARLARVAHRGGIIVIVGPYKKGQAQDALARVASRDGVHGVLIQAGAR